MTPDDAEFTRTDTELAADDRAFASQIVDKAISEADRPRNDRGQFTRPDGAEGGDAGEESTAEQAEDAAPEETPASGEQDQGEGEPEHPAIDPPASWTAEARDAFAKLPPELQQYVSTRESDREKGINAKMSELAEARRKIDPEYSAITQERAQLAQVLGQAQQIMLLANPVLSEGMKTDWAAESAKDPAGTQTKWFEYQRQMQVLQAMTAEKQRLDGLATQKQWADYGAKVREVFPDYADPVKGKALIDKWAPVLIENGFTPAEVEQTRSVMFDPRLVKSFDRLYEKAAKWDAHEKALKTVQTKRVEKAAQPVVKPKVVNGNRQPQDSARVAELRKQADRNPTDMRAVTDFILARAQERPQR